jgi:hypothetical protein
MDDLVCLNPDELKKRREEAEFESTDRIIRENKPVEGPL